MFNYQKCLGQRKGITTELAFRLSTPCRRDHPHQVPAAKITWQLASRPAAAVASSLPAADYLTLADQAGTMKKMDRWPRSQSTRRSHSSQEATEDACGGLGLGDIVRGHEEAHAGLEYGLIQLGTERIKGRLTLSIDVRVGRRGGQLLYANQVADLLG